MKSEVTTAIGELQIQFSEATICVRDDGQGGAYLVMEPILLGKRYQPDSTWIGFQIPAQYPYADIYPVFVGAEIERADREPFKAPVTPGHSFEGRPSLQVSRRNSTAQAGMQKATSKILKIIDFLGTMK